MSSPPPTTLPSSPSQPRRASRFTEGSPLTGAQLTQQTSDNSFLLSILSQMDEHEASRREQNKQRSESNASTESFTFTFTGRSRRDTGSSSGGSNGGSSNGSSPVQGEFTVLKERVGRRSITFGRRSLDERPKEIEGAGVGEGLKGIFKGRLRALTGGRERNVKPYEGT
ncbi:hypothetical protein VTL71DRAFT_15129 [Oculimacula yallundae]|uniref:Uncharacterized protein n=1 Tax=Oculimacula yallundae TaxID=86028 RepID=A0ABR4CHR6_9HELO